MSRYPTSTSSSISTRLQSYIGQIVSARNIRCFCREENYRPVRSRIHWIINETQGTRRLQYTSAHAIDNWEHIIFSDEKFVIDEPGTVYWIPIAARRSKTFLDQVQYR
ncbi:unnamed protein product, partial [Rotaria sordida]